MRMGSTRYCLRNRGASLSDTVRALPNHDLRELLNVAKNDELSAEQSEMSTKDKDLWASSSLASASTSRGLERCSFPQSPSLGTLSQRDTHSDELGGHLAPEHHV